MWLLVKLLPFFGKVKSFLNLPLFYVTSTVFLLACIYFYNRTVTALKSENVKLTLEIRLREANLGVCNAKIDLQNNEIKHLSEDNINLKEEQVKIKKQFSKIRVPKSDSTCKVKLNYYEKLLEGLNE